MPKSFDGRQSSPTQVLLHLQGNLDETQDTALALYLSGRELCPCLYDEHFWDPKNQFFCILTLQYYNSVPSWIYPCDNCPLCYLCWKQLIRESKNGFGSTYRAVRVHCHIAFLFILKLRISLDCFYITNFSLCSYQWQYVDVDYKFSLFLSWTSIRSKACFTKEMCAE